MENPWVQKRPPTIREELLEMMGPPSPFVMVSLDGWWPNLGTATREDVYVPH